MSTFTKTYIGKGKKHPQLDIITVTIAAEAFTPFIREHEGINYLTFEVASLKETDNRGRTHTAYIRVKEMATPAPAETAPEGRKARSRKAKA